MLDDIFHIVFDFDSFFSISDLRSESCSQSHGQGQASTITEPGTGEEQKEGLEVVVACATMNKHMYVLALLIHE